MILTFYGQQSAKVTNLPAEQSHEKIHPLLYSGFLFYRSFSINIFTQMLIKQQILKLVSFSYVKL